MTTPLRDGAEFLVNTTTTSNQSDPTITALADGRFVVAWTDGSQSGKDSSGNAVRAQIFAADGQKQGGEFLVNTTTTSSQSEPTITALADGRFVVAWTDDSQSGNDTSGLAVRTQLFAADGKKQGKEFLVNTITTNSQRGPTITALADGRFVVAWTDFSQSSGDISSFAVRAQIFAADGQKQGGEFLVNTTTTSSQSESTITALADGRFVVAWSDSSQSGNDTSSSAVRAQILAADGEKQGAEFLVNTTTTNSQSQPTITALADGRFVVAWSDFSQGGGFASGTEVRAQLFATDGRRQGKEFLVNTTTTTSQYQPTITALADGRFVVAWSDFSESGDDTSGYAVRAQLFAADGGKQGNEFLVNTTTPNWQESPTITALADGRFVVAWRDDSQIGDDTSDGAVRAQLFDGRSAAIRLGGTLADDDFVGTIFGDLIRGSYGSDRLRGRAGDDELAGQEDADTLEGGAGNDRLDGGEGDDHLLGGYGSDRLLGGGGNDLLEGGAGADLLFGGGGNDAYLLDTPADRVLEAAGEGIDEVRSATFSLDLRDQQQVENGRLTGSRALALSGNDTANTLVGNGTANTIGSGGGADTLIGGGGADRLRGGSGKDTFLYLSASDAGKGAKRDRILDFIAGSDRIDLSSIDADATVIGNQSFVFRGAAPFTAAGQLRYTQTLGLLEGETNGDKIADFRIDLAGRPALAAADLVL